MMMTPKIKEKSELNLKSKSKLKTRPHLLDPLEKKQSHSSLYS